GGIYKNDTGTVKIDGVKQDISNPAAADKLGIAVIHQELNLIKDLTVAENIFLGKEIKYKNSKIINTKLTNKKAKEYLDSLGMKISPDKRLGSLSVGEQQMVEIAKALSKEANILVLDEPTAALTAQEVENLFKI